MRQACVGIARFCGLIVLFNGDILPPWEILAISYLIRASRGKPLGMAETICKADCSPMHNQQPRLVRWAEYSQLMQYVRWFVSVDPPSGWRPAKKSMLWDKMSGFDSLSTLLYRDRGIELVTTSSFILEGPLFMKWIDCCFHLYEGLMHWTL